MDNPIGKCYKIVENVNNNIDLYAKMQSYRVILR